METRESYLSIPYIFNLLNVINIDAEFPSLPNNIEADYALDYSLIKSIIHFMLPEVESAWTLRGLQLLLQNI